MSKKHAEEVEAPAARDLPAGEPPKQNMDRILVIEVVDQAVRAPKAAGIEFVNHSNRQMVIDLDAMTIKLPPGWKGLQV